MKESYGGTWIFIVVVAFLLLFTGIMCLTINQSKAFAVKSDLVNYIENNNGIDITQNKIATGIVEILSKDGYFTTGTCGEGYYGFARNGERSSNNAVICLRTIDSNQETGGCYYEVKVFYRLDLPVISSVFNFSSTGKTRMLYSDYCPNRRQ